MSFRTIEPGRPIRLAFLGCGGVTRKHSQTLRRFAGVKRYYASRSAEKAAAYCREWKGSGAFDSYAAAIKSAETDVVLIATPPDSHLDLALHAIRAGKHVIIEKPPLFHASDFDLLETARQKTGVQVMVAENYFYKPLLRTLRESCRVASSATSGFCLSTQLKHKKQAAGGMRLARPAVALFTKGASIGWIFWPTSVGTCNRSGDSCPMRRIRPAPRIWSAVFSWWLPMRMARSPLCCIPGKYIPCSRGCAFRGFMVRRVPSPWNPMACLFLSGAKNGAFGCCLV
ncbi:MAG: Gfo/Idh/MocA family oxidoreductase [Saprospirales bacterium]|nr:Gfo/Idh/MocA family oxidoreductase [Saprospirales bacterium]